MKTGKLWGKRFEKKPSVLAESFTSGRDVRGTLPADERLIPYDLWGSRAHVVMLAKQKILLKKEGRDLLAGLRAIGKSFEKGDFRLDPSQEDVHSNVESWLIDKYGVEIGGRLHTARSRNDQIALDMRLYLRDCALNFFAEILALIEVFIAQAKIYQNTLLPGYTHHQPAQVTTLGHVYLSYGEALVRDGGRFQSWFERFNRSPLGSMTGYGTSLAIDRELTARLLGFDGPCANSLDPIQNRWEPEAELGFAISALMNHLSSLAQTLILFSTGEFGLIRLDDAYCSGSSMMPQKRNPDPLEIIKAKTSLAQGALVSLLSIGRSLFLGYNRDTQWTKYLIMDLVDECFLAPKVMAEMVATLRVDEVQLTNLCQKGFITTPDLLERIVQGWGVPFRRAKAAMEKAVKLSAAEGGDRITLSALKRALREEGLSLKIDPQVIAATQEPRSIVSGRKAIGGTSPSALKKNIQSLQRTTPILRRWLAQKKKQESTAKNLLAQMERDF